MKKGEKKEPRGGRIASISGWRTNTHEEHDANLDEVVPGITGTERSPEEQVVAVRLLLGLNQLVILLAVQ